MKHCLFHNNYRHSDSMSNVISDKFNILVQLIHKIALKWMPKQKRAQGRLKKNWMEGIRKAMNERNLNKVQWEDRKQCRKTF